MLSLSQVLEIRPLSVHQLPIGARVCTVWSSAYICLFPGTIPMSKVTFSHRLHFKYNDKYQDKYKRRNLEEISKNPLITNPYVDLLPFLEFLTKVELADR